MVQTTVPLSLFNRGIRMDVCKLRPGDGLKKGHTRISGIVVKLKELRQVVFKTKDGLKDFSEITKIQSNTYKVMKQITDLPSFQWSHSISLCMNPRKKRAAFG